MRNSSPIHWIRAALGGIFAEIGVFIVVFSVRAALGQTAFLVSILVASAFLPLLLALWVCRKVKSQFVFHGTLVGTVAALTYLALAWGQPEPMLYKIAHGLKLAGGAAGGFLASRSTPRA
ncbi:MAG TPA: hypothetical protein VMI10_08210 [Terriglobales bacterium]|nr:hypothetical protein [Terriglobales bacterium]